MNNQDSVAGARESRLGRLLSVGARLVLCGALVLRAFPSEGRVVARLFLYFLKRNRLLLRKDGSKRIADHTLVALTVMIAESKPSEKEMMVNLVMNFLA